VRDRLVLSLHGLCVALRVQTRARRATSGERNSDTESHHTQLADVTQIMKQGPSYRWGWYATRQRGITKVVWAELRESGAARATCQWATARVARGKPCRG
jgi:hypothetical protein